MKKSNILDLKNVEETINILKDHISSSDIDILKKEKEKHIKLFLKLANSHLKYAKSFSGNDSWRQIVSSGYYACYCASRALRLFYRSDYSRSSDDHKKIDNLPDDFDDKNIWKNFLKTYRGDRNLSDYDHYATKSDLEIKPEKYIIDTEIFIKNVKNYIKDKK